MENEIELILDPATAFVSIEDPSPTVSVLWDQAAQAAVIDAATGPTIASRAYAMAHTAIFDAWAQFDGDAVGPTVGDQFAEELAVVTSAEDLELAKAVTMSFAAQIVLDDLFPEMSEAHFQTFIDATGIDITVTDFAPDAPFFTWQDVGTQIGQALLAERADDGANQANGYADTTGYAPVNASPFDIVDITRWTPESVPIDPEDDSPEQSFLTPHWGEVTPFGLETGADLRPVAPEPFFVEGVDATLDIETATITFNGDTTQGPLAVSRDQIGTVINPAFIEQAEALIETSGTLTDEQKVIAEFWEDGGGTSFPPGTWMTFGQLVSARNDHSADEDALLFFALGNAVMDAGIATWEAKAFYDYARPVRAIRDLGTLGLIGTEGTDELTGEEGFVIDAWGGVGQGTRTILAENFITYQNTAADASPPFAEYTSGHSAFSAAGAQVLRSYLGTDDFGASITVEPGQSLFEPGVTPAEAVTLAWETFTEAADEGGVSRIYGGIHFEDGDLNGRTLGQEVGRDVWSEALLFATGAAGEVADQPEAAEDLLAIGRFYDLALGRVLDTAGYNFWVDVYEDAGASLSLLAAAFLGSSEFALQFGDPGALDDETFVQRLLANVDADEADIAALADPAVAALEGGASRASVLVDLAEAAELTDETLYLNNLTEEEEGVWGYA